MPAKIHNVATNIISGFLGVGKTTAILDLFSKKPATEKWAVLVNEFGKTGIDGRIYQANNIAVKQIPGGCMCCAQGLPLQVAVNRLLAEARPDRLIIESSGIGHPGGVLKTLQNKDFHQVLKLKAGICLLDPECLLKPDYQQNELFKEQIQFADILVANKTDLASAAALQAFDNLSASFNPAKVHTATTMNAQLDLNWLGYDHQLDKQAVSFKSVSSAQTQQWQTHSFRYPENTQFDIEALTRWLGTVNLLRLKGLIQTTEACYLLNGTAGQLELSALDYHVNSYIEVIDENLNIPELEAAISRYILD